MYSKKTYPTAAILLIAIYGALATGKKATLNLVWYESETEGCIAAYSYKCPWIGFPDCVELCYDPISLEPIGHHQIYNSKDMLTEDCIEPFTQLPK